jgi:hypothetical protein
MGQHYTGALDIFGHDRVKRNQLSWSAHVPAAIVVAMFIGAIA